MKRYLAPVSAVLFAVVLGAHAQGLDEQYFDIFNLIQQADGLAVTQPGQALAKYAEAQAALQSFQRGNRDWNSNVISFRLSYVTTRIGALTAKAAAAVPPATALAGTNQLAETNQPAVAHAEPARVAPADWEAQLNSLKDQVRQMQSDRNLLEAKLKEALAMQPAEADPRELNRAEEKIKALQKENELLKVTMENKAKAPAPADSKDIERVQQALAEANRNLAAQKELASKLTFENQALESRVKALTANTVTSSVLPSPGSPAEASRILELQREREDLQKRLDSANKEIYGRKGKVMAKQMENLDDQLASLRLRLEIFEARAVPYSAEELAMLKQSAPKLPEVVASKPAGKSIRDVSPAAARRLVEARRYYEGGQYAQAEAAYLEVLREDRKNVSTLANLAAIQVQSRHFESADANIKEALALEPDNSYALSVLGHLRYLQGRYDDAVDALGRAAKLDPQSAEIENFLGLALLQKGMRAPGEAALRKAVQLDPAYGSAHNNLAVVYLNQQPPAVELARWHYQKALAAGFPKNPELEKKFDQKK